MDWQDVKVKLVRFNTSNDLFYLYMGENRVDGWRDSDFLYETICVISLEEIAEKKWTDMEWLRNQIIEDNIRSVRPKVFSHLEKIGVPIEEAMA